MLSGYAVPAQAWCPPHHASVRRPGRVWGHREHGQRQQYGIIVHAPARKVLPRLLPIGLEGHAVTCHLLVRGIELAPGHADRVARLWVRVVLYSEEVGDAPQSKIPCP